MESVIFLHYPLALLKTLSDSFGWLAFAGLFYLPLKGVRYDLRHYRLLCHQLYLIDKYFHRAIRPGAGQVRQGIGFLHVEFKSAPIDGKDLSLSQCLNVLDLPEQVVTVFYRHYFFPRIPRIVISSAMKNNTNIGA
jgi:hypothetical protein